MDPFLEAAIAEAEAGLAEGGIPIGSVPVFDGQIIGRRHNRRVQRGSAVLHGEMDALENASRQPASTYARRKPVEINHAKRRVRVVPGMDQVADRVEQARALPRVVNYRRAAATAGRSPGGWNHVFFVKKVYIDKLTLYNASRNRINISRVPEGESGSRYFGEDSPTLIESGEKLREFCSA
jgi:hypothetical protein